MNDHGVEVDGDVKEESPDDIAAFGSDVFGPERRARIAHALAAPLTRREVLTRPGPGGTKLTYLEGWRAVDKANRIFGYNGWSSKVSSVRTEFIDEPSPGRFTACCTATVIVSLRDGTHHEDVGSGSAEGLRSKADALGKARKEAVTDARKRALKNFGNALGNSLYDREHLKVLSRPSAKSQAPATNKFNYPPRAHTALPSAPTARPQTPHRPAPQQCAVKREAPIIPNQKSHPPVRRQGTSGCGPETPMQPPRPQPRRPGASSAPEQVGTAGMNAKLVAEEMAAIQGLDFGEDF